MLFKGTDAVAGRVSRTNKETLAPSLSQEHKRSCAWVWEGRLGKTVSTWP